MRARPGEAYSSRRTPVMRAENFNRSFQVKSDSRSFRNLRKNPFWLGFAAIGLFLLLYSG